MALRKLKLMQRLGRYVPQLKMDQLSSEDVDIDPRETHAYRDGQKNEYYFRPMKEQVYEQTYDYFFGGVLPDLRKKYPMYDDNGKPNSGVAKIQAYFEEKLATPLLVTDIGKEVCASRLLFDCCGAAAWDGTPPMSQWYNRIGYWVYLILNKSTMVLSLQRKYNPLSNYLTKWDHSHHLIHWQKLTVILAMVIRCTI